MTKQLINLRYVCYRIIKLSNYIVICIYKENNEKLPVFGQPCSESDIKTIYRVFKNYYEILLSDSKAVIFLVQWYASCEVVGGSADWTL